MQQSIPVVSWYDDMMREGTGNSGPLQAMNHIVCLTGDKVSLIQRLLMQVEHILQNNEHYTVTKEVIGTE